VARSGAAAVKAALASIDRDELVELTRDLIRIPSVVRPGDPASSEAAVARHVEQWLGKLPLSELERLSLMFDIAEIHGGFSGELTVRKCLTIHATGQVTGKIRYGKLVIEEGGEISGDIKKLADDEKSLRIQHVSSGGRTALSPLSS